MSGGASSFSLGILRQLGRRSDDAATGAPGTDTAAIPYIKQLVNLALNDAGGLSFRGTCPVGMSASTTAITVTGLSGYGDDFFNDLGSYDKYYLGVLLNANSHGAAPETEYRRITDYDSDTFTFTCSAFSANVEAGDEIMVVHVGLYILGSLKYLCLKADATLASVIDDSIIAHILSIGGDVSDYDDTKHSLEAIGTDTDALIASLALLMADVGDASGATLGSILGILGNPATAISTTVGKIPLSDGTISWNATALAAIQAEVEDALEAEYLDHLLQLDSAAQPYPVNAAVDSIIAKMISKGDPATPSTFNCTTDSQEAISDKIGAFSGDGGAAADDSVKALLDLIKTAVDDILDDTGTDGVVVGTRTAAFGRLAGVKQYKEISVTSAANAGADTTLATVTTQGCVIEDIVIHADAAQTGDLTSCPVQGGASKAITFIAAGDAVQAELDAESKQVWWDGHVYLPATETIVMVHNGTGATALDLTVTIGYRATVDGGYLA